MGRTFRKRRNKRKTKGNRPSINFDNDEIVINLKKFMAKKNWKNHLNLKLKMFPETGRGVYSSKNLKENQLLIKVPFDLMITFTTLQEIIRELLLYNSRLKIHDLLALFLILEKSRDKDSVWWGYIQSLPNRAPFLYWAEKDFKMDCLPEDLKLLGGTARKNLLESWDRIQKSLKNKSLVDFENYLWGYSMVNTRSVYINPEEVLSQMMAYYYDVLLDEPSMALCPFLDMFNHNYKAKTEVLFTSDRNQVNYQLISHNSTRKYQEIFISYGPHDNSKLLTEYGFFIPGNGLDAINFHQNEIIKALDLDLDKFKYDYVRNHKFDSDLYILYDNWELSFNLKAFLFVSFENRRRDYSSVIFGDSYGENFLGEIPNYREKLVRYKVKIYENDLENFQKYSNQNDCLIADFLKYRISSLGKFSLDS